MMRNDGTETYFLIQHRDSQGWSTSALDHFLFDGLSFDDRQGEPGGRYRLLLAPQSASSDLWQRSGIHGFEDERDARAALNAVRKRHPRRAFRLVRRTVSQSTELEWSV